MHSSHALESDSFAHTVDDRPAQLEDVLPGFHDQDRLGILVREPCGALGASTLLLAAITGFFDVQRSRSDDFFIYPDYFLFHVGQRWGDYNMLDVWPDHKEVVVPADDAEQQLQAINDRGITRLLVPDDPPGEPDLTVHTRSGAESRIVTALVYAAAGRVADADVTVRGNEVTESYVQAVIEQSTAPGEERERLIAARGAVQADGLPLESYRRTTLADALARLG